MFSLHENVDLSNFYVVHGALHMSSFWLKGLSMYFGSMAFFIHFKIQLYIIFFYKSNKHADILILQSYCDY